MNPNQIAQNLKRKFSLIAQPNSVPYTNENGNFDETWIEKFGGTKIITLSEGTDIDTLKQDGTYYIKNPTSTKGMPIYPKEASSRPQRSASYAIIKVSLPPINKGTYFVYQEMILWNEYSGVDSIDQPVIFVRTLTDFSYLHKKGWQKLNNNLTIVSTDSTTIKSPDFDGCQVIINGGDYPNNYPTISISSLTISNISSSKYADNLQIIFKAGNGFALTAQNLNILGQTPSFVEDSIYCITINGCYGRIEEVTIPQQI